METYMMTGKKTVDRAGLTGVPGYGLHIGQYLHFSGIFMKFTAFHYHDPRSRRF